eukprot:8230299-Pyramimonas_sp.AAC.1
MSDSDEEHDPVQKVRACCEKSCDAIRPLGKSNCTYRVIASLPILLCFKMCSLDAHAAFCTPSLGIPTRDRCCLLRRICG